MKPKKPVFRYTKPSEWTKNAEKLKKLRKTIYKHCENTNSWNNQNHYLLSEY